MSANFYSGKISLAETVDFWAVLGRFFRGGCPNTGRNGVSYGTAEAVPLSKTGSLSIL